MNACEITMTSLAIASSPITAVSQSRYKAAGSCFFSSTRHSSCLLSKIYAKNSDWKQHISLPDRSWIRFFGDDKTCEADHFTAKVNSSAKEGLYTRQAKCIRPKMPIEKNPKRLSSNASPSVVLDYYQIFKYPLITESAMTEMIKKNTLIFVVDKDADKRNIKEAARMMFGVETKKVNTLIMPNRQKKAYLILKSNHNALEIAKKIKAL